RDPLVTGVQTCALPIYFFPPSQQNQARVTLASALRGIVCQRLVPMAGGGRIAAIEVLVNTGRVAERVLDPALTAEIKDVIREGRSEERRGGKDSGCPWW